MNIIVENGLAVRIPEIPSRYRANCSRDFGLFVKGDTNGLNILDCQQKGLLKGNFVDMAICWIQNRILTFEPHYFNEQFTEIWGIPVAGEMKTQFADKASELSTFMIHRQSKDKIGGLLEEFSREAFNHWVLDGMQGTPEEYAQAKSLEFYFSNIFRFELTKTESSKYGAYHYVATSVRKPSSDLDNAALIVAKRIYLGQLEGETDYCTDQRLVENEQNCLAGGNSFIAALPEGNDPKQLAESGSSKKSKSK